MADRAPELEKIETLLDALHAEMFAHLQKEEQVLVPFHCANGSEDDRRVRLICTRLLSDRLPSRSP